MANGVQLATAYVNIEASTKGLGKQITKALGAVDTSGQGTKSGKAWAKGFDKAAGGLSLGAIAGAAAKATELLVSGLGRYMSAAVEASDSTDKFKSTLNFAGVDTDTIDRLTKSTQAYADATVYDLADIRNVTAQLAANGVKDYDRLAEAAGNLNAVAGGNAETFKSVGMVLTQTAGQGKLTTENFNQLSDAIPGASGKIQKALADMGAYTGNFRDAMEKGEISAEEFNQAIMELGMTDAAQEAATSTKTFEGALGNWDAAIQKLITKGLDAVKPAFTKALGGATDIVSDFTDDIGDNLDDLQKRFDKAVDSLLKGDIAQAIGDVFDLDPSVVRDLGDAFDSISEGFGDIADSLREATPGLEGADSAFSLFAGTLKTTSKLLPAVDDLIDMFTALPEPVQLAAAGLVAFHKPLSNIISIARGVGGLFKGIADGIGSIGDKAGGAESKTGALSSALAGFNPAGAAFAAAAGIVVGAVSDFALQAERAKGLSAGLRDAMKADADAISSYWESISSGENEDADLTFLEKLKSGFKADDLSGLLDKTGVGMDTFQQAVMGSSEALDQIKQLEQRYFNNPNMMGSLEEIEERVTDLSDTYRQAIDEMVDASQSLDGIDQAYRDVSAGVTDLGTTLKANNDAMSDLSSMSEASRGALESFSASVWQNVDSIIANADAYGGMDSAVQTAKNRVQEMRDALIGQLTALGQTDEQAAATADALGLIPSNVTTDVKLNAGDAKLEVQAYLDTLNMTPEQKSTFMNALTDAANGDIDNLKLNMDTLPDIVTSFLKADPSDADAQIGAVSAQLQLYGMLEPTALLKADKSDADAKTAEGVASVRNFGAQTGTARLDADKTGVDTSTMAATGTVNAFGQRTDTSRLDTDNTAAISKADSAKGAVDRFGNCRATAVVDVQDNASGPLDGILGKLGSIASRAWNAVVNTVTGGGHAYGGLIDGGRVTGPGSRMSDTAQITPLSAGEYVIRAKSASRIGYTTLDQLNETGTLPDTGADRSSVRKTGRFNTTAEYADERVVALLQRILLELEAGQRIELDGREMGRMVRRYANA